MEVGELVSEQFDMRKTQLVNTGFEDQWGHEPRDADSSRSWKRQESRFSPRPSRKECCPANALMLTQ